eukprot:TRINITY_DN1779_c1_g2_i1.p1 TRINITY_DN1779_c1_g2~~TRINITY_DN1779_c1_g2_i1.p1  ORF type:complete len:289 (+),score=52.24 TRINITY_DN1779_c1_g2_i1:69-935(+)
MFAGLSLVVTEFLVGTTTMNIKVAIEGPIADPSTFIAFYRCAAFPGLVAPNNIDWGVVEHVQGHSAYNGDYPMNLDFSASPFTPGTAYTVKCCTVDPPSGDTINDHICGELEIHTQSNNMCVSGVSINSVPVTPVAFVDSIDMGHTRYFDFPTSMADMVAYPVPRPLAAGTEVTFTCCDGEECVFAAALYRCTACTGPKPHGVNQKLLLDNWGSSSCSPKFDDDFKTVSFYKEMGNAHETISFNLNHDEVLQFFGRTGTLSEPFCKGAKQHGPFPAGPNCGDKCPPNL